MFQDQDFIRFHLRQTADEPSLQEDDGALRSVCNQILDFWLLPGLKHPRKNLCQI